MEMTSQKPLEGVRILDLSHAYSGPFCTMHLADQGAEVIKIEVPGKGDQSRGWSPFKNGYSGYYAYINRNKYGMTLNLKTEEGKEIFKELVKQADVVCENLRVGTMDKLGLGYDVLKEINPRIIYASISGFGLEGEMAKRPCYDVVAQAMGGIMSMTGAPGMNMKVGPAIGDNYSGTYLSLGIVMALYQREKTGLGRRLDVSMIDTIVSVLENGIIDYTIGGEVTQPIGNSNWSIAPFDVYKTKDGMVAIGCGTDNFFRALSEAMGRPELADDPRFKTNVLRVEHYQDELKPIIDSWAAQFSSEELESIVSEVGVPCGMMLTPDKICELDIIKARNMLWKVYDPGIGEEITIPGTPIKMHGCEDKIQRAAPTVGQDTNDILNRILGYDSDKLNALADKDVI